MQTAKLGPSTITLPPPPTSSARKAASVVVADEAERSSVVTMRIRMEAAGAVLEAGVPTDAGFGPSFTLQISRNRTTVSN
jgi:hypothetical protein